MSRAPKREPDEWEFRPPPGLPSFGRTFAIPLSASQFACIGRVVTLLGIIETYVEMMTSTLAETRYQAVQDLFYGTAQFGTKVDLLGNTAKVVYSTSSRPKRLTKTQMDRILRYCEELKHLSAKRNHAVHGRWGYNLSREGPPVAADSPKRSANPLPVEELTKMLAEAERMARQTWMIWRAIFLAPEYRASHTRPETYWFHERWHPYTKIKSPAPRRGKNGTRGRGS